MDNNTKQTNNDQQTANSTQPVANTISQQDTPPVLAVEDVVPPMPQVGIPQKEEDKTTQVDKEEVVDTKGSSTSSGSAAPSDDIQVSPVVIGTTPKKKFGSGKVIATILGLFLLVGGLGAGTMLVQQNQDIRERAGACGGGCGGGGQCAGDLDGDGGGDCVPRGTTDEEIEAAVQPGSGGLDNIGAYEPAGDANDNPILPNVGDPGTEQTWNEWQNEQQGITSNNTSGVCTYASIIANVGVQECTEAPIINESNCPGCTIRCGAERCEVIYRDGSQVPGSEFRISASAGGSTTTTGGGNHQEETPPTTPPTITATCQNVKAYSTSWTELTTAQLSALTPNTTVNFCVTGALTDGSFTKARFTINGVLQPETTTVRPSSTDFCQSYVIPAGVTSHNVTAQIYHNSLGWK